MSRLRTAVNSRKRHAIEAIGRLPRQDDAVAEVRRALGTRIVGGNSRIEVVARELGISPRTMQRKLAAEGVSYQTLLEDVRKEAAGRRVSESRLAICEVAFLLGY